MEKSDIKTMIDVNTGMVEIGDQDVVLKAPAIGSCVIVVAYCLEKKLGALAHVMLPGKSPTNNDEEKIKYAYDAIETMLEKMDLHGIDRTGMKVCLVGGANVLQRHGDVIGKNNIDSIVALLNEKNITIEAQALGGIVRRSVTLDIEKGNLFCAEGNEGEKLLWAATLKPELEKCDGGK